MPIASGPKVSPKYYCEENDVNAHNKAGATALKLALAQKDTALIDLLKQNGAKE